MERILSGTLLFALWTTPAWGAPLAGKLVEEHWEAAYVGTDKIGHIHVEVREVAVGGKPVFHTRQYSRLEIQRFGQKMVMESVSDSFELPDGRLYALDTQSKLSNDITRTQGRIIGPGKFEVTVEHKGSKVKQALDWPAGVLGPYASERALKTPPLKPGAKLTLKTFLPELNVIAERQLSAGQKEETQLVDNKPAELLRVTEKSDKVALESTLWINDEGEALKMSLPLAGIEMITFRVDKEKALEGVTPGQMDFGFGTLVKPDKPIPNAHTLQSVTYRFTFADDPAASTLPTSIHQKILERENNTLVVKEQRAMPAEGTSLAEQKSPGPEFLASNTYIQPDNAKIRAVAEEVTKDWKDPWDKARRLEEWVDNNMTSQDFSIGFAPSSEIIETRQGDCTEHAVLLAALCRSINIPARVAMGLVYLETSVAFGYHMWTEVYIGGEWYAIDGTIGHGGAGAGHIKIADGSLEGVDANSTFLPIFKVIGKLKIEVLETNKG